MENEFWAIEHAALKTAARKSAAPSWAPAALGAVGGAAMGGLAAARGKEDARREAIYDHPELAAEIDSDNPTRLSDMLPGMAMGGMAGGFGAHVGSTMSTPDTRGLAPAAGGLLGAGLGATVARYGTQAQGRRETQDSVIHNARNREVQPA